MVDILIGPYCKLLRAQSDLARGNARAQTHSLIHFSSSSTTEPIFLGKLRGVTALRLEPDISCLKSSPTLDTSDFSNSPYASKAISHPDLHPSKGRRNILFKVEDDVTIRRFISIGWVYMQTICGWDRTGHVLVLDAERRCHPWFVLAHEWEDDTELCETIFAQKSVRKDDSSVHDVFPGDRNRTSVARLCYQDPSDDNGFTPFVL